MRLFLDKNNVIVGYQSWGNSSDGIEYDGALPDDFEVKFKPSFYMLQNEVIVENPNYVEPTVQIPKVGPSKQDKINAQLILNQATQNETQAKFNAQILLQLAKGGTK